MSIANLTRYVPEIKMVDDYPYVKMSRSKRNRKSYVKFEEAMEASSNILQQLKADMVPCPFHNDTVGCPLSSELWLCGDKPCLIQRTQHQ